MEPTNEDVKDYSFKEKINSQLMLIYVKTRVDYNKKTPKEKSRFRRRMTIYP